MIDATPRHLLIWGNLDEREKTEVITKFKGPKFNVMNDEVKKHLWDHYKHKLRMKVMTK